MKTLFWLVLISLVVAGVVVGQEQARNESTEGDETELMLDTLLDRESAAPEEVRYAVIDKKDIPDHIARAIDATKMEATSMVFDGDSGTQYVYISLGERRTGGYHINIEGVERVGNRVSVLYSEIKPAEDAMVIQALTYPWIVLRVHSELPVDVVTPDADPEGVDGELDDAPHRL